MPRVGFEPTIPVFEREKTVHALDHAATVIGGDFELRDLKNRAVHFEFEVLTTVTMKSTILWDATPCLGTVIFI
jgi:hypothetical protein